MFRRILTDRRILLLAAEFALVIALTRIVLTPQAGFSWVIVGGYWFTLALVTLFFIALGPAVMERWRRFHADRFDWLALGLVLLCVGVWSAQEKPGFKILADEVLLLGTSMGMHYDRSAATPVVNEEKDAIGSISNQLNLGTVSFRACLWISANICIRCLRAANMVRYLIVEIITQRHVCEYVMP